MVTTLHFNMARSVSEFAILFMCYCILEFWEDLVTEVTTPQFEAFRQQVTLGTSAPQF